MNKTALIIISTLVGTLIQSSLMAAESKQNEVIDKSKPADKQAIQLENIEVLGTNVEQDVNNINTAVHSVSITTAQDLEDSTMLDLRDVFSRTANIQEDFNIRGIGAFSVAGGSLAASPLVGMYVDGAIQSTFGLRNGALELWDVAQVEVYRGAQSINLGRSSLAGGVAIKTKDPTYDWTLDTRMQAASYNGYIASAAGGGPIIEDQLAFRLAFDYQTTDGFVENPILDTKRANDNGNTLLRGKLLYEPQMIPALSVLASMSYSENREGDDLVAIAKGRGNTTLEKGEDGLVHLVIEEPISPFKHKIFSNHPGFENVDTFVTTLDLNYELNTHWRLQSLSTFTEDSYERQDDVDRRPNPTPQSIPQQLDAEAVRIRHDDTQTFTQEVKFHYETDRLHGQVGGYYYNRKKQDDSFFTAGLLSRDARFEAGTENWALTGKLDYDVTDKLTLFAGARYDVESFELLNFQEFQLDYQLLGPDCIAIFGAGRCPFILTQDHNSDSSFNAFLPQAGLTINWTDDLSTSFVWKEGYRPGGTDLKPGNQNDYDAEFTTNYELSLRSNWLDDRLQLDVNLYYTEWEEMQLLVFQFERFKNVEIGQVAHTENAGSSELYGFEIELKARPIDNVSLFANLGYSKTKFIDFSSEGNVAGQPAFDFSGQEFQRAPRVNASIGATYRHQNGFFLSTDYNYKSDQINAITRQSNKFADEKLPGRAILNMKLGYEFENVALYLYARNLLDEEYITHRSLGQRLRHTVRVGEPRIIGLQLLTYW